MADIILKEMLRMSLLSLFTDKYEYNTKYEKMICNMSESSLIKTLKTLPHNNKFYFYCGMQSQFIYSYYQYQLGDAESMTASDIALYNFVRIIGMSGNIFGDI